MAIKTLKKLCLTDEFKEAEEKLKRQLEIEVAYTKERTSSYYKGVITIDAYQVIYGGYRSGFQLIPFSMERLIAHEAGHVYGPDEKSAIDFENAFMSKYYYNPPNTTAPK